VKQISQNLKVTNKDSLTHGKARYDKLPMIVPTMKQMPENKPRCLLSVTSSVGAIAPNGSG